MLFEHLRAASGAPFLACSGGLGDAFLASSSGVGNAFLASFGRSGGVEMYSSTHLVIQLTGRVN